MIHDFSMSAGSFLRFKHLANEIIFKYCSLTKLWNRTVCNHLVRLTFKHKKHHDRPISPANFDVKCQKQANQSPTTHEEV